MSHQVFVVLGAYTEYLAMAQVTRDPNPFPKPYLCLGGPTQWGWEAQAQALLLGSYLAAVE